MNDYLSKAAKMIINYCIDNDIGTIVFGYNKIFQKSPGFTKTTNQSFVNIPFGKLQFKLKYLCELNDIKYVEQEESYTSQSSFWDKDNIPEYKVNSNQECNFSGKRTYRGMHKRNNGKRLNADVNGALNILRKSNVVSLGALYSRGEVDKPVRIRVAW